MMTTFTAWAYSGDTCIPFCISPKGGCGHKHRTEQAADRCARSQSRAWDWQVETDGELCMEELASEAVAQMEGR